MVEKERFTITQASEMTGYEPHVIRYYEKEFNLKIPRNKANHRYFTRKEIDLLNYIKQLQEKGFNNTQIKSILKSQGGSEQVFEELGSIAVTQQHKDSYVEMHSTTQVEVIEELKKDIIQEFRNQLECANQPFIATISELAQELKELVQSIKSKEDDVVLCENAKLKMQLKKKTYEIIELKEQLRKEREKSQSFLGKVFKK